MKILMFFPGQVDHLPPMVTAAVCMADLGATVRLVACGIPVELQDYLNINGVEVSITSKTRPTSFWQRALLRGRVGIQLIREKSIFHPECIWYHGPFAMEYALIPGLNRNCLLVAHAHELCDKQLYLGFVSRLIPRISDVVITPEINRLWILKISSKSNGTFFCIPNNNQQLNNLSNSKNEILTESLFQENGGSKICTKFVVYQGAFMSDRCLPELIEGFKGVNRKDTGLILLGGERSSTLYSDLENLAKPDSRIVFLPRINPPNHLKVTAGCIGGILLYKPDRLNNIYCAPNKIFEYASLGLGMVLPNYPGLQSLNLEFNFGELCDPTKPDSIRDAIIRLLDRDVDEYHRATKKLLNSSPQIADIYSDVYKELNRLQELD